MSVEKPKIKLSKEEKKARKAEKKRLELLKMCLYSYHSYSRRFAQVEKRRDLPKNAFHNTKPYEVVEQEIRNYTIDQLKAFHKKTQKDTALLLPGRLGPVFLYFDESEENFNKIKGQLSNEERKAEKKRLKLLSMCLHSYHYYSIQFSNKEKRRGHDLPKNAFYNTKPFRVVEQEIKDYTVDQLKAFHKTTWKDIDMVRMGVFGPDLSYLDQDLNQNQSDEEGLWDSIKEGLGSVKKAIGTPFQKLGDKLKRTFSS